MPLPIEKQVVIIYAGTQGYVDKLPVDSLKAYEQELYRHIDEKHPDLWKEIREKREIKDDLKKKLEKVLEKFSKNFVASED